MAGGEKNKKYLSKSLLCFVGCCVVTVFIYSIYSLWIATNHSDPGDRRACAHWTSEHGRTKGYIYKSLMAHMGSDNDKIAYMWVQNGCFVQGFLNIKWGGKRKVWSEEQGGLLGRKWANDISSYACQCSRAADKVLRAKWMSAIPDDTKLGAMSIPGTHDTMTKHSWTCIWGSCRTQGKKLWDQLEKGIRFVDIRLMHMEDGRFAIYHGPMFLDVWLEHVLRTLDIFLAQNPSETIIMSWQKEWDDENPQTFCEDLGKVFRRYTRIYSNYKRDDTPTLGELRGNIFLMNFHGHCTSIYGYVGHTFDDEPHLVSSGRNSTTANDWKSDLSEYDYVKDLINNLRKSKEHYIYTTWLSFAYDGNPLNFVGISANRYNGKILEYLEDELFGVQYHELGVVVMDFPTDIMISFVIAFNDAPTDVQ